MDELFLPTLAKNVAKWFPELEGRALAVSESDITKDNIPTLPLCMVALVSEKSESNWQTRRDPEITEDFLIEFWFEPERYKNSEGGITPFWAYYNYERIRDTLIEESLRWETPKGGRIEYQSMTIEAEDFAVVLSFRFDHEFKWCPPVKEVGCDQEPEIDGLPFDIKVSATMRPDDVCCNCKLPSCKTCNL